MSLICALVQSVWSTAKRPRFVQVAFSAAALVVSSSLAYKLAHPLTGGSGVAASVACVIVAGSIYFPVNSTLVSVIIALVGGESLGQVCERCYQWVFPYFMGGIAFAGLISGAYVPSAAWKGTAVLIPAIVLAHVYFRGRTVRHLPTPVRISAGAEEYPVEVGR